MKKITIICRADQNPVTTITLLLSEHDINIEGFNFNRFGDDACLAISVSDYDASLSLLINHGYNAISDEAVLIQLQNRPGELAEIARVLTDAGVQVRSLTVVDVDSDIGLATVVSDRNDVVRDMFPEQLFN